MEEKIREIKQYLESGHSQAELSRISGISSSAISQILNKTYQGDYEAIISKLCSAIELEIESKKSEIKKLSIVNTNVLNQINNALLFAKEENALVALVGEAGIGKTTALKEFKTKNKNAIMIEVDPTYRDITLLRDIAEEINIDTAGSKDYLFRKIVKKLQDSGRIIIVDEADYLRASALDIIRRINDKAGVPAVLVGLPRLMQTIAGTKQQYYQIYSRIQGFTLPQLDYNAIENMVRSVFDCDKTIVDKFVEYSRANARRVAKLIATSQRLMVKYSKDKINMTILKSAYESINI